MFPEVRMLQRQQLEINALASQHPSALLTLQCNQTSVTKPLHQKQIHHNKSSLDEIPIVVKLQRMMLFPMFRRVFTICWGWSSTTAFTAFSFLSFEALHDDSVPVLRDLDGNTSSWLRTSVQPAIPGFLFPLLSQYPSLLPLPLSLSSPVFECAQRRGAVHCSGGVKLMEIDERGGTGSQVLNKAIWYR